MKKILIIANYKPHIGGISGQVEILQRNLRDEGFLVDIFNTKGHFFYRLQLWRKLKRIGQNYDIFHIHACSNLGFLPAIVGIDIGKKLHKRVILTYHGGGAASFFTNHKRLVKKYLLQTDVNIVLSEYLGSIFQKFQIPYTIIPNVIELKNQFKERECIHPNFISIRSLTPLYNIECILKAYEIVKKQFVNAMLTIVGDGPSRKDLEEFVKIHQLKDVVFVGKVDNCDIYRYLDQADIMLSSPRIDNMPVSILEGMNAGLLVISSNVGGVPYMIEDGVNGLLFESDNAGMLAGKMMWAIQNQNEVMKMILNSKDIVQGYSWNVVGEKIMKYYV